MWATIFPHMSLDVIRNSIRHMSSITILEGLLMTSKEAAMLGGWSSTTCQYTTHEALQIWISCKSPLKKFGTCATEIAEMRRGCVTTMEQRSPAPFSRASSSRNCGSCVVLPQPVAPLITTTYTCIGLSLTMRCQAQANAPRA